jgi:hypothetical protein
MVAKKLSIRTNGRDDTRIVDVRSTTLSPPPAIQGEFVSSFFSERTLTFLGIIASIIALSLALWAIHKNSDLTKRLTDINMSVVDLIVESKNTPVVENSRSYSVSKTIKDKLEAKRLKRQQIKKDSEKKPEPSSKALPEQPIIDIMPKFDTSSMNANFLTTKAQLERQNEHTFKETNRRIEEMKQKRIDKLALKEQMNQKPVVQHPQFPSELLRDPMNKAKFMIDQMTAMGSQFNNVPLIPEISKEDIDLDDLERDLKLLETGR